jgi:hypothetical protein
MLELLSQSQKDIATRPPPAMYAAKAGQSLDGELPGALTTTRSQEPDASLVPRSLVLATVTEPG